MVVVGGPLLDGENMNDKLDIIECRRVNEQWECCVHIWYEEKLIKFCEGFFEKKEECLEKCLQFAKERIEYSRPFKFISD